MAKTTSFFHEDSVVDRLIREYDEYAVLYIAFDFDDTIFGPKEETPTNRLIIDAFFKCKELGFKTILYTCREGDLLIEAINHLEKKKMKFNYINSSPVIKHSRKPFFNLLLDDRAGLKQAYESLLRVIEIIETRIKQK